MRKSTSIILTLFFCAHGLVGLSSATDVNDDENVDLMDTISALQVITGTHLSHINLQSDVNNDSKIGLQEAIHSLALLKGNETKYREPDWPLEVISWDLNKAYPGIEYNYRLAVRGGKYPYSFSLHSAPIGMRIDELSGVITWTPNVESENNLVSIVITDSKGDELHHTFSVDTDQDAFSFVSSQGNDSNNGSESSPWASLSYASRHAGVSGYIYVKSGTYQDAFSIDAESCGRFLAYPGDEVTVVGNGEGSSSISIRGGNRLIFQGFTFDANNHRWMFSADSTLIKDIIWRKNIMRNVYSQDRENPAFIFFWDGTQTPIEGEVHYKNIVMQENTFHDLDNIYDHGASTTLYDVQDLIYEDNTIYDIDGRGVSDKDDGYRNTFRNNIIYNCKTGIALWNQNTQGEIEISHNLIYDCESGVVLGGQPGYLRDVFLHHNTIIGNIVFSLVVNNAKSVNYNIYSNIIGDGKTRPYSVVPVRVMDDDNGYHYEYPDWFQDIENSKVRINNNLLWGVSEENIAGFPWGIPQRSLVEWKSGGFDVDSIFTDPELDSYFSLSPASPYWGIYGRD